MQKHSLSLLATSILFVGLSAMPSSAEDYSAGRAGTEEGSRAIGSSDAKPRAATPSPGIMADRSASRALEVDDAANIKSFTIVGRSSAGKDVRIEPGESVLKAIKGGDKRTSIEGDGVDKAEGDAASRDIVGGDNRVQVTKSTTYPYSTIGYLEMENAKGEVYSCTAALIGTKVALTAGHCLYNHAEKGGWRDKFTFWPAVNGESNVPYGGFEYDTVYVFAGFIDNYQGSYDTVWPFDIGLVTFKDPIGDTLGWLGYSSAELGDFQGNLVGYHDDKAAFTMWRSTCNVMAENIGEADFNHDCDFTSGASGAPIYYYDDANKSRVVVGVNMGPSGNGANWALRLYAPIYAWINTINQ